MMSEVHFPSSEEAVAALVREAAASGTPIRIQGGGTRTGFGGLVQAGMTLSTAKLTGITLYEPAEMVIGAKSGTPLAEVEATLAEKGQMLAFEPMDHRELFASTGTPTIGAVAAGNISGPRRIWAGACRDSLIGVRFVNGAGEIIKSGGRVMKNVTGLDLVKLQAGAWGTLGVLTEVIFKIVPKPETVATLVLKGLDNARAVAAMAAALGSPFEITGAAHDPARQETYLRIEGFGFSVDYRAGELAKLLANYGTLTRIDGAESAALWTGIRDCAALSEPREAVIWRLSVKPSEAPKVLDAMPDARALMDWGGGLIWLATEALGDGGASRIRAAAKAASGYATLIRAPDALRVALSAFQPEEPAIAALSQRIRASVDASGLFNPGMMR
jgi:glycolate oxidase FAD binding subunit